MKVSIFNKSGSVDYVDKNPYTINILIVIIIGGLYCSIQSFKSFPIAEGWYTVFAKYINSGKIPYRDFELHFTPLYTYLVALITRIFGYEIYILRIFGIFIYTSISVVSFLIFRKLFGRWVATACALITVLFMQSEPVQIFYDYIRVFDLFAYLATYMLMISVERLLITKNAVEDEKKRLFTLPFIACGLFTSLAVLTRQNSGAFVWFYSIILIAYLIYAYKMKVRNGLKALSIFMASFLLPIAILCFYMVLNGSFSTFLSSIGGNAIQSKGGLTTILFAWMKIWGIDLLRNYFYIILIFLFVIASLLLKLKYKKKNFSSGFSTFLLKGFCLALALGILGCYFSMTIARRVAVYDLSFLPSILYMAVVLLFAYRLFFSLRWRKSISSKWKNEDLHLFILAGMILAIGYGSGTSAALCQGQTALAAGLVFGYLISISMVKRGWLIQIPVLMIFMLISMNSVSIKYIQPYTWWGLAEEPTRFASESLDVNLLHGIKVSEDTKEGIEKIVDVIENNSSTDDSIFVFPHAPIFYAITDRYPQTYTLVQWFDVASDENVTHDIAVLEENPPQVIVQIYIPEFVMSAHESMFRDQNKKSGLRQMDDALHQIIHNNNYKQIDGFWLQEYFVEIYSLS